MSTITIEQQQAIKDQISSIESIPAGSGTKEAACSVVAINLALTGELTDSVPECMSKVIGWWIIVTQDRMPSEMRNSKEWRELLPVAAGTGRLLEKERLALIIEHMWSVALPLVQPVADVQGYGTEWARMLRERTPSAASYAASYAAAAASASAAYDTAYAAAAASYASAAYDTAYAAAAAAASAAYAASADAAYTGTADDAGVVWQKINPCGLLKELIEVEA